jgi:2-iminobutanoate/2-iminopropanoate deaminase
MIKTQSRRNILKGAVKVAAAGSVALATGSAQTTSSGSTLEKKSHSIGPKPEKTPLFSSAISYGNLLFLAGIGAHFPGDIKAHTAHVLDEMKKQLENAGSSMEKVLKVNVYLNDLKDYAGMNEVFQGRFGSVPPVRTTVAPAGGIPGNSLVEIECIAYI